MQVNGNESVIPLDNLASFMQSSLLDRQLSAEDYSVYRPIIDEVAFYATLWQKDQSPQEASRSLNFNNLLTMQRFANSYDIRDAAFNRGANSLLNSYLESCQPSLEQFKTHSEFLTLQRTNHNLSNQALAHFAKYVDLIDDMTASQVT
jgi:hypothetical protein